jgi:hypothetical protein
MTTFCFFGKPGYVIDNGLKQLAHKTMSSTRYDIKWKMLALENDHNQTSWAIWTANYRALGIVK